MTTVKKIRLVVAWVVGLYLASMFVSQGMPKFDPNGFWTEPFERWGYPSWLRVVVGGIEVVGGIALIIPWIASWGGVAIAVVMGGAWVTRAGDGRWVDVAWITLYLVAALWIAWEWWGWRKPEVPKGAAPAESD